MKNNYSRREFIKTAGLGTAALVFTKCDFSVRKHQTDRT